MTATDAVNTQANLVYIYPELITRIGPSGGAVPSQTFENVYCSRVVRSAGGSRLDYADLPCVLTDYLQNRSQPALFTRMISVHIPDGSETRVHLGDYVAESYRIDPEAESLTAQSQLRHYHFGHPVRGYDVWSVLANGSIVVADDIVFNPTIDDQTLFNMSDKLRVDADAFGRYWIHPETCLTEQAESYQQQVAEEWDLPHAIESMCELLNLDAEFIRNPTWAQLTAVSGMLDAPELRNVRIPIGATLPQVLDLLLIPHGFNWYVNYDTATQKPQIVVFKIGAGTQREIYVQAPNQVLNLNWSNANNVVVENSIADAANRIRVFGEYEEVEVTLPLYPAWDENDDALTASDLDKQGTEYPAKETVHRLWIANEAADIDPSVQRWGVTPVVPDLSAVVTKWIPHRRTIGEPLTYQGGLDSLGRQAKQRRPVLLEYSIDAGATWLVAKAGWSKLLCPNQIGILFDGDTPPAELVEEGEQVRMRITGTVFSDHRLEGLATKEAWAVNGRVFEQVISAPQKFQKRWRQAYGPYMSALDNSDNEADERNDTDAIKTYAESIRDQSHHAEVSCEFRLPGFHKYYEISDLITKVNGRELNLDAASTTSPTHRYVQVTEIRYEMSPTGGPSTVLIVDRGVDENATERLVPKTEIVSAVKQANRTGGV